MDFNLKENYVIIPEWGGNKEDANPMEIHCSYLDPGQLDECTTVGSDGVHLDRKKYFTLSVNKLVNCNINGKGIFTAKEFLKQKKLSGLYVEVTTKMISLNNEEPSKNSLQPTT